MSDEVKHSKPISIPTHSRRPASLSGSSSSEDDSNSPPLQTPTSPGLSPRARAGQIPASPNASTSPILSYFFAAPPKSASAAVPTSPTVPFGSLGRQFPFGPRSAEPAVLEEEEDAVEPAIVRHARRLSATGWPPGGPASRFGGNNPAPPPTAEQQERGAGIFRRLSLGGALTRPQVPAPQTPIANRPMADVPARSASPPGMKHMKTSPPPQRRTRRSATTSEGRRRRAPSPMGERILKGHFDGFN